MHNVTNSYFINEFLGLHRELKVAEFCDEVHSKSNHSCKTSFNINYFQKRFGRHIGKYFCAIRYLWIKWFPYLTHVNRQERKQNGGTLITEALL